MKDLNFNENLENINVIIGLNKLQIKSGILALAKFNAITINLSKKKIRFIRQADPRTKSIIF